MSATKIAEMIANPEAFGFSWGYGELNRAEGRTKVLVCKSAPYMVHEDVDLLRETFGDQYFLEMANGTSGRVRDQKLRDDIIDDASLAKDDYKMKEIILERAFGTRTRRSSVRTVHVQTFIANDGAEFATKLEAMQHNKLLAAEAEIDNS